MFRGGVGILRHYSGNLYGHSCRKLEIDHISFTATKRDPGTVSDVTQLVSARHAAIYIVGVVDTVRQIAGMTLTFCVIVYAG